ncbi:MAG: CDP-diacylglycerol--serine O-phosphatidyltransferase [Gammaproteobacteria bacterium]|nr:CDP-diacylglycerol--serine O-phosphatidyltransferase [Gammaproteobacteria bacterium]
MTKLPEASRARGIYLLPNLFTLSALFAGFYAVVAAMKGVFEHAAIAIFVAMLMDSLDGRVARLTNTQTPFGAQLDSLSDMISFGIAPALVIYSFSLNYIGKLGWLAAFVYTASAALRLARFNTRNTHDKRYFQGLPSPAGAAIIASIVWACVEHAIAGPSIRLIALVVTPLVGLLMVSNVRYRSFKDLDLKGNVSFMVIIFIVFLFVLIAIDPPDIFFLVFILYGLSGPVTRVWHSARKRRMRKQRAAAQNEKNDAES